MTVHSFMRYKYTLNLDWEYMHMIEKYSVAL